MIVAYVLDIATSYELRIASGTSHYSSVEDYIKINATRLFPRAPLSFLLDYDAMQLQRVRCPMAPDLRPLYGFPHATGGGGGQLWHYRPFL